MVSGWCGTVASGAWGQLSGSDEADWALGLDDCAHHQLQQLCGHLHELAVPRPTDFGSRDALPNLDLAMHSLHWVLQPGAYSISPTYFGSRDALLAPGPAVCTPTVSRPTDFVSRDALLALGHTV